MPTWSVPSLPHVCLPSRRSLVPTSSMAFQSVPSLPHVCPLPAKATGCVHLLRPCMGASPLGVSTSLCLLVAPCMPTRCVHLTVAPLQVHQVCPLVLHAYSVGPLVRPLGRSPRSDHRGAQGPGALPSDPCSVSTILLVCRAFGSSSPMGLESSSESLAPVCGLSKLQPLSVSPCLSNRLPCLQHRSVPPLDRVTLSWSCHLNPH